MTQCKPPAISKGKSGSEECRSKARDEKLSSGFGTSLVPKRVSSCDIWHALGSRVAAEGTGRCTTLELSACLIGFADCRGVGLSDVDVAEAAASASDLVLVVVVCDVAASCGETWTKGQASPLRHPVESVSTNSYHI